MRGGGLSDEAQMTECTHETLRLAPKTVTKTHEERLRPYALQVLLDAHADAWQAELEAAKAREDALNNIMHRAALVVARSSPLMDRTLIARTKAARWALKELADALAVSEPPGED